MCGTTFRLHQRVGLLLYGKPGAFTTGLCGVISLRDLRRATHKRARAAASFHATCSAPG
jgi:hypothetical protein